MKYEKPYYEVIRVMGDVITLSSGGNSGVDGENWNDWGKSGNGTDD